MNLRRAEAVPETGLTLYRTPHLMTSKIGMSKSEL